MPIITSSPAPPSVESYTGSGPHGVVAVAAQGAVRPASAPKDFVAAETLDAVGRWGASQPVGAVGAVGTVEHRSRGG